MLEKARQFAVTAHGDQKYGQEPYSVHLEAVVELLEPYGEDAMVIGYLHDVLEDTDVDRQTIECEFGEFVATCVSILKEDPGPNRRERKRKSYARLATVKGREELALIVSAADRLANIQACIAKGDAKRLKMYKAERIDFNTSVHRKGLCDDLWSAIDDAFAAC
ncbi:MAG: bifunctional (p)ppGpp synthetase/guanosine-3',5'-bis(diphosphate) 3'-pyrophosphohydrolase [Planctomycetaceae bacterium]|nr:bifunctional (p)ppGpp synthetase/guanosine-3',5'-bis(diphosphate) 3'-pyrophosphohydrolase [Planctomycetaceae bacterium]